MKQRALVLVVGLLTAALRSAAVTRFKAKLASRQEIMDKLTTQSALQVVLDINSTHASPELLSLIQSTFAHALRSGGQFHLRAAARHQQDPLVPAAPRGDVGAATLMLNSMISETTMKLELKQMECSRYEEKRSRLLEDTRQDISAFNSRAAEARGRVLKAQDEIGLLDVKLPRTRDEYAAYQQQCTVDVQFLQTELSILNGDLGVVSRIVGVTQCPNINVTAVSETVSLVQCSHCGGMVMLQHDIVQPMLNNLRSKVAREYLQDNLAEAFAEANQGGQAVALTQAAVKHMKALVTAAPLSSQMGSVPRRAMPTSDMSWGAKPRDCNPTTRCTIGEASCPELADRFSRIQAGIVDKQEELSTEIAKHEAACRSGNHDYIAQISTMEDQYRQAQTNLAMGTKDQVQSEATSRLKGDQHAKMSEEHTEEMTKCCDNQNELRSESCALEKIRGELLTMAGQSSFIRDCEVSDWSAQTCSKTCGRGVMIKTRSIIVNPAGGTACPPLEMQEACAEDPCPVDCLLEEWSGWSACSGQCGGGVRERTRSISVAPQHDGSPCEHTEEEEACNVQSCDADCELGEWSAWSGCSKACGRGALRRTRGVSRGEQGMGTCPSAEHPERLQFTPCNDFNCTRLLPADRTLLKCISKVDVIVLLDGSGSLGPYGWQQTKLMGRQLVAQLQGGNNNVRVAVLVFSTDMYWLSHLTGETERVAALIDGFAWPGKSTYTHVALAQAANELQNGREDASAVVIVITDGRPQSRSRTRREALRLQRLATVVWVPVGDAAPLDLILRMASLPQEDHVVQVDHFQSMADSGVLNSIIADACPKVI